MSNKVLSSLLRYKWKRLTEICYGFSSFVVCACLGLNIKFAIYIIEMVTSLMHSDLWRKKNVFMYM